MFDEKLTTELEEHGRVWFRQAVPESELQVLEQASALGDRPGARLTWDETISKALGAGSAMAKLAEKTLPEARPVRLVSFNKSPLSNWAVPWHQDRVLALSERHDVAGFSNWAQKNGTWHAEPPISILECMVFARVHFDDTDESNGCLELAVGTHTLGLVPSAQAQSIANKHSREICRAKRGDVLFVKALTHHKSSSSHSTSQRRALRIDYSNFALPRPLAWAYQSTSATP